MSEEPLAWVQCEEGDGRGCCSTRCWVVLRPVHPDRRGKLDSLIPAPAVIKLWVQVSFVYNKGVGAGRPSCLP